MKTAFHEGRIEKKLLKVEEEEEQQQQQQLLLICFQCSLSDEQSHCRDKQIVIAVNAMSYTQCWISSLIFDNRVHTNQMHGTHHPNYYHSSQTLGYGLCDSEASRAFQPRPCYTTLTGLL